MSGALPSSLREKFRQLRQWQMQQQEDFLKKQIEHKKLFGGLVTNDDKEHDSVGAETAGSERKYQILSEQNSDQPDLMHRMSASSLQTALSIALDEIGSNQNQADDDDINNENHSIDYNESIDEHSKDLSDEDGKHLNENLWNKSLQMQTVVFKPQIHEVNKSLQTDSDGELQEINDGWSEDSRDAESMQEVEGIYPIVYSEDNFSDEEKIENNHNFTEMRSLDDINLDTNEEADNGRNELKTDGDNIPFDERPVQSKIGYEVKSFEELVEKELKTEITNVKKTENAKKPFLRKGAGTARFKGNLNVKKKPSSLGRKSSSGVDSSIHLPGKSLKLIPDSDASSKAGNNKTPGSLEKAERDKENEFARASTRSSHHNKRSVMEITDSQKLFPSNKISEEKEPILIGVLSPDDLINQQASNSSIEASFQQMLQNLEVQDKVDDEELEEFELLEEAAADTSLSSNASVVLRMMANAASKKNNSSNLTSSPVWKSRAGLGKRASEIHSFGNNSYQNLNLDVYQQTLVEDETENSSDVGDDVESNEVRMDQDYSSFVSKKDRDEVVTNSDEFLDHSAWADSTQQSADDSNLTITESPHIKSFKDNPPAQDSPPPISKLMKQIFPKLENDKPRSKEKVTDKRSNNDANVNIQKRPASEVAADEVMVRNQSDVLKAKLSELEMEISKFKKENATIENLRAEREKELSNLRNEIEMFQKQRSDELERIEKFKTEEMQKLKREKKLFEKYQKTTRMMPNKKDREEIESLKNEITEMQDELKRRETRWNGSAARFRRKIEELENENYELKESLKVLEEERLQRWSKADTQSNKTKQKTKPAAAHSSPNSNTSKMSIHDGYHDPNPLSKQQDLEFSRKSNQLTSNQYSPEDRFDPSLRNEQNPRLDILPQQQPPTPRRKQVIEPLPEKPGQRLSLTPEKHMIANEDGIQEKQDAALRYPDGKVERLLSNGSREITFPNGTRKIIDPTNQSVVISFFNGDMKQMFPDERIVYYYAESKTTHTTYKDGLEVFEFSNGQTEKHYPNGRKEIIFTDQTVKCIFINGAEETVFADGTIQNIDVNGNKTISFPNGQREIHTQHYKKREYPDGTVKTVYQDGRQETKYASGRLRVKDHEGNILVDTGGS